MVKKHYKMRRQDLWTRRCPNRTPHEQTEPSHASDRTPTTMVADNQTNDGVSATANGSGFCSFRSSQPNVSSSGDLGSLVESELPSSQCSSPWRNRKYTYDGQTQDDDQSNRKSKGSTTHSMTTRSHSSLCLSLTESNIENIPPQPFKKRCVGKPSQDFPIVDLERSNNVVADSFVSKDTDETSQESFNPALVFDYAITGDVEKLKKYLRSGFPSTVRYCQKAIETDGLKHTDSLKTLAESSSLYHAAILSNSMQAIKACHAVGMNPFWRDSNRNNCLQLAILKSSPECVRLLLDTIKGLRKFRDEQQQNYAHYAARRGDPEIMDVIATRCSVNIRDEDGWTPLSFALMHRDPTTAIVLIDRFSASPSLLDAEGNNAFHWAAYYGNVEALIALMERPDLGRKLMAVLNSVNGNGDTPLHIATRQNHLEVVRELLKFGVSAQVKNLAGLNALKVFDEQAALSTMNPDIRLALEAYQSASSAEVSNSSPLAKCIWPMYIVCSDISNGRERYPVCCISHISNVRRPRRFSYICTNVYDRADIDLSVGKSDPCFCNDNCSTLHCNCCRTSLQVPYDKNDLVADYFLNKSCGTYIFECNQLCSCNPKKCLNRVVQRGSDIPLRMFWTESKGWGVMAEVNIRKGAFVIEYVGEYIRKFNRKDDSYVFQTDHNQNAMLVDASKYGNVARFINHSCKPNLKAVKVFTTHLDFRFPQICFFAVRDIECGEELSFDYGPQFWCVKNKVFSCKCEYKYCRYREVSKGH